MSNFNVLDRKRFDMRIVGEVLVSADIYIGKASTASAAEVNITEPALYDRISQYALLYGKDLQGLFQTDRYQYMSCFIGDVQAFETEFQNEDLLKPLFNHNKGETAEFLISFPERVNFNYKESVKKYFLDITQKHVETLDEITWNKFERRALTGATIANFENDRCKITELSRKNFVEYSLTDSFEVDSYVNPLFEGAQKIGEIGGCPVFFNSRGFYFYWNKQKEYLLESWLTFPAYPYGRLNTI